MSRWKRRKKRHGAAKPNGNGSADVGEQPILAICIPSDDHVHAAFCLCMIHMAIHTTLSPDSGLGAVTIQHVGASILPHSRYTLVKKSLEQGATHLLFIDSDMTFPADTALRLLRHDVDMVGVNAMSRRPPYHTTAWLKPGLRATTTRESTGLEKAWRTGFAVVMIRAEVFKTLEPPYFDYEYVPETDAFRGEDYIFFDRALAAGFQLHIDHDLSKEVNHIGSFAFNPVLSAETRSAPLENLRKTWGEKEEHTQAAEA